MKRLLLATSILGLAASGASAEITLSGDARMGIIDNFGSGDDVAFTSRARVTFTMSGESDSGISFGASFRADNASGAAEGTAGSVFVSGAFGKLSMGDVDGAAQSAVGNVDGVGLTGLSDLNEMMFVAGGGFTVTEPLATAISFANNWQMSGDPTALYEYSTGGLSIYASHTNPAYVDPYGGGPDEAYALGASYTFGDYKVSAGYEALETVAGGTPDGDIYHWILGVDATLGAVVVKARYGEADIDGGDAPRADATQYALSATYTTGAVGLTGFVSNKDLESPVGAPLLEVGAVGVGASYDLGGGAKVVGGIVRRSVSTGGAADVNDTAADLGLSFSF